MKLTKEQLACKLNTWKKHVEVGDSKLFFEWNTCTGVSKEIFIKELEWLFNDPQDAVVKRHSPFRREICCNSDGTISRFIRIYEESSDSGCIDAVSRVSYEDYVKGFPAKKAAASGVGILNILDPIEVLDESKQAEILAKAKIWKDNAKKWGVANS